MLLQIMATGALVVSLDNCHYLVKRSDMYATPAAGGILWPVMMVLDRMEVRVDVLAYLVSGWQIWPSLMEFGWRGVHCS